MNCPVCGQENPAGFKFCGACGAELDAAPATAREERKVITVLFADLVGFTSRAEKLDPEDVRAMLSPYYARLRHELERHGGTVEKFIGDAVVALFGAPIAHEDDPDPDERERDPVRQRCEDLDAPEAERPASARRASRERGRDERERKGGRVGEHVPGVGEKRERARGKSDDDLGDEQPDDERERPGEHPPVVRVVMVVSRHESDRSPRFSIDEHSALVSRHCALVERVDDRVCKQDVVGELGLESVDQQVLREPLHRRGHIGPPANEPCFLSQLTHFNDRRRPQETRFARRPASADTLDRALSRVRIARDQLDAVAPVAPRAPDRRDDLRVRYVDKIAVQRLEHSRSQAELLDDPARLRGLEHEEVANRIPALEPDQDPSDDVHQKALSRETEHDGYEGRAAQDRHRQEDRGEHDQDDDCGRVRDRGRDEHDRRLAGAKLLQLVLFARPPFAESAGDQLQRPPEHDGEQDRKSTPDQAVGAAREKPKHAQRAQTFHGP